MNQQDYAQAVHAVLDRHTDQAAAQLRRALEALPDRTRGVTLDILVDQGGEGFLTVRVGLEGPDLYVLNQAIAAHACLFDTTMHDDGLHPGLPLMGGDAEFPVGQVLTDTAARWLQVVWQATGHPARGLPVRIDSPEGHGRELPVVLQ